MLSDFIELLLLVALWGGSFLFMRMAALMYAIPAPYTKRQLSGVPPLAIATVSQLSAAVFLLPALPFTLPKTAPTPTIMLSVLVLALFSTALAYILYFRMIQNVGSVMAQICG